MQQRDQDGVRVLTIRRPKVLNALDQGVFAEIAQRFEEADADPTVQAVVITGFGKKAFVSGADVRFLAKIQNKADGIATSSESQGYLQAVEDCSKPTLCAYNGLAYGGGNELAMCCNMRISKAGLDVLAAQPEPNLGIIPGAGGTQRLPRWVGLDHALPMLRTGRPISSAKALEIGLITEEVDGDLVERAIALAKGMADGSVPTPQIPTAPLADVPAAPADLDIRHLSRKVDEILCRAVLDGAKRTLADGIRFEAECFGDVCATKDMRIGVDNFITNGPRSKAPFVHE